KTNDLIISLKEFLKSKKCLNFWNTSMASDNIPFNVLILISDSEDQHKQKFELEENLEYKNEEINVIKEELKQKSPNYARSQERIKPKRYNKFLQPITN
ncbi:hypothetical protein J8J04_02535, partial ['Fragaria x ananassa' phyllody phytoplasma]|nr:hypothetical protein ['Fragaria x ananassa' phyllody phytoplasma]